MRGQKCLAIAVRRPDGELHLTVKPVASFYTGRLRGIPLVRGVVVLVESLILGVQSLLYSASVSLGDEGEENPGPLLWATLAFAVVFAVAFFFVVPLLLVRLIEPYFSSSLVASLVEGLLRIGLLVMYLGAINLVRDIRRVFAYHGAEHTVINAYEDGMPLEVESVEKYSTAHTRCGTSFLLTIMVVAVLVFALVGQPSLEIRVLSRILLVPIIAGLGYEINRLAASRSDNRAVHALLVPGLALQALTTRKPDKAQIEVALAALRGVVEADSSESGYPASSGVRD